MSFSSPCVSQSLCDPDEGSSGSDSETGSDSGSDESDSDGTSDSTSDDVNDEKGSGSSDVVSKKEALSEFSQMARRRRRRKRNRKRRSDRERDGDIGGAGASDRDRDSDAAAASLAAARLVTATGRPYHFGTHYSSAATVLHYLLRLQPYASAHVHFQG